eukprot:6462291-Amphidinium_carterae.1
MSATPATHQQQPQRQVTPPQRIGHSWSRPAGRTNQSNASKVESWNLCITIHEHISPPCGSQRPLGLMVAERCSTGLIDAELAGPRQACRFA